MEKIDSNYRNNINLQNYCRTCGNSTDELISIFDDEGLGYELNIKISTYLHLQVSFNQTKCYHHVKSNQNSFHIQFFLFFIRMKACSELSFIQVDKSDKLPLNICIECTTTLLSFHNLYLCCLKAKEHYNGIVFAIDSTDLPDIQRTATDVPEIVKYLVEFSRNALSDRFHFSTIIIQSIVMPTILAKIQKTTLLIRPMEMLNLKMCK